MNHVGVKIFNNFTDLASGIQRDSEILIKRKRNGCCPNNHVITIHLLAFLTDLTRCDHQNFVATSSQTARKIAAKRRDAVDGRIVEVRSNKNFHLWPIIPWRLGGGETWYNTPMKLFFDARYMRTDFHDGISRYSAELGTALARQTKVTFLICDEGQRKWLPKNAETIMIHKPTSAKEPFTAHILNKYEPDVVYSPMQTIGTAGRKYKAILTTHDMIYYRHKTPPRFLPAHVRLGWRLYHLTYWPQRLALNSADLVTTVSETSARDLERVNMTKHPIIPVPNAPQRFHTYPVKHSGKVKNIIYMGSFMPYKNAETLIAGMQWLPGRTLHLLSRISPKRQAELEALVPGGAKVIFHGGVSDDIYEQLLADNAVLATASYDEGYGIPVAEALAMGVPVVASNIPVFHEVGAGGAVYFDPSDPKAFADAVIQFDQKKFRDEHIKLGLDHMASFSWDSSARTLLKAIKTLV